MHGKQCVAMSLCSIVYNEIKSVNVWDTSIMNQILVYGNNLNIVYMQARFTSHSHANMACE
jgi:hypothetical protein